MIASCLNSIQKGLANDDIGIIYNDYNIFSTISTTRLELYGTSDDCIVYKNVNDTTLKDKEKL